MEKTLVLGIGNTIRGDDGVGIFVARVLREQMDYPNIDIREMQEAGINLLNMIEGYEKVIIIDSIHTRDGEPGGIYRFTKDDFETAIVPYSWHQVGLATVIHMTDNLNMDIAEKIVIYAIEIEKGDFFGGGLSSKVREAIPKAVNLIKEELSLLIVRARKEVDNYGNRSFRHIGS